MSEANSMDCRVGRLEVMRDPVADCLDDMAALGEHWTRNREKGRMPGGIRAAMVLVAREMLSLVEQQERETQQLMDNLCGPAAFARNAAEQPNNTDPRP
jgi:hypothetical protein